MPKAAPARADVAAGYMKRILGTDQELFNLAPAEKKTAAHLAATVADVPVMRCPKCGSEMLFVRELLPKKSRAP